LLARSAPVAVVFRRGPARSVCTLRWDRRTDTFTAGQWLKGRIYERRADLAPDGKHLIYFAMDGRWHRREARGSWTAVSRAPYLKALALYPKGDCWHGGGLFTGDATYWVNGGHDVPLRETKEVRRVTEYGPPGPTTGPVQHFGGECPSVYYPRLLRDGWTLIERVPVPRTDALDRFDRPLPASLGARGWVLRKIAHSQLGAPPGKGCYWDEHELAHPATGRRVALPDWEWAELDADRDRLVWASRGKLYAGRLNADGMIGRVELVDLNPMTFEPIAAPY
jgi:hypothetical protein